MTFDGRAGRLDPILDRGNDVVMTNGSGVASFTFNKTFPSPPVVVASGGNDEIVYVLPGTITTTGFDAQFRLAVDGSLAASINVRAYWIAVM